MPDFEPLQLPPGIVQHRTPASSPGRWYDGNLVRWSGNTLYPIKGWAPYAFNPPVASKIRQLHTWTDNSGISRIAVLCEANIYVIEGATLIEITPAGGILGAPPIPGVGGYNVGAYGAGPYSAIKPVSDTFKPIGPAYTLDNWGQTLLIMASFDGRLLQWDPSLGPGNKAVAVNGAPVGNRFFTVTDERHVVLWQIGGAKNTFGWCSQENINDWNFGSVTNSAGEYNIEPSSPIISAQKVRAGVLFFTNDRAYIMSYIGAPYIYNYVAVADAAVPISNGAIAEYGGNAVWFSENGFWVFDGSTASPLNCDVINPLLDNISNLLCRYYSFGVNIQTQNEFWFFYPSGDSTECNSYVIWNFSENWWSLGTLSRTCAYQASFNNYPLMSDGTLLYQHEKGQRYYNYSLLPFATTSALSTKGGTIKGTLVQMITDNPDDPKNLKYSFSGRNRSRPDLPSNNTVGPKNARADGYLDVRITARDIQMTLQSADTLANNWSFGVPLVKLAARGKR